MITLFGVTYGPGWPKLRGFSAEDNWLIPWTTGWLTVAGTCLAVADLGNPSIVDHWTYWGVIIAMPVLTYLSSGILLARHFWESVEKNKAEATEEAPAFHALFGLLFLALCILAWIAFGPNVPIAAWPWNVDLTVPVQRNIFFALTAAAFIPLLFGFHTVARETGRGHRENYLIHPEGPVGWSTLLSSLAIVSLIALGAWAAGERMFAMEDNFGLIVMIAVVAGFLAFIFVPHLGNGSLDSPDEEDHIQVRTQGPPIHPGYLISGLDAAAVRLLAPLSGATQSGRMVPQLILTLLFIPLSAMGYSLPAPWGLVPIGIAAMIIFGLGRRWAWVENDREKALRIQTTKSSQFRLGFANDLRDEALMGYLWLFILVPLALRQVQMHFDLFEASGTTPVAQTSGLIEWIKFFGTELAKGVPIVDWVDIYAVDQKEAFSPKGPLARHIVFVSRLLVDVVIIAALLQAFGIMQRNRAQEKLFASGQIDFFDPFMERSILRRAYCRPEANGIPIKARYLDFFKDHRAKSAELDKGDYFYNTRRLNELYNHPDRRIQAVARWLARDLIVGSVTERLVQIATLYMDASAEERDNADWTRKFYRYFDDVIADSRQLKGGAWRQEHSIALSRLLFQLTRDKEYDQVRNRAFAVLGKSKSLHAARALAARLVRPEHATNLPGLSQPIVDQYQFARQPRQAERSLAVEGLLKIKIDIDEGKPTRGSHTLKFIDAVLAYYNTDNGNRPV